jgi:hypothetical protein
MKHKILVVLIFFSLLASCTDEKNEPEYPTISQAQLDRFLSQKTISLSFDNNVWTMSIDDMQAYASNMFINWPVKDSIALTSGLLGNYDDRHFYLYAGVVPFNDDNDVLTKHFLIGYRTVGSHIDDFNISMYDPNRPNSIIELLRIKVVKVSHNVELYLDYKRKIKVWFLLDFNIKDNSSGIVVEKIRNAKYINEFFLIDFSNEPLNPVQTRYDKITTP